MARHKADYDHLAEVHQVLTMDHYRDAVEAIELVESLRGTPDGREFFALIALHTSLR